MLTARHVVLASQSPRRISLLRQIGLSPTVHPADIPEDFNPLLSPEDNAEQLALAKASVVAAQYDDALVVGADTIVLLEGEMLAKPADEADAKRMLGRLSNKTHVVITGFALVDAATRFSSVAHERTYVTFRHLPDEEIDRYIAGGSPMDKAGAYGIQDDYGAVFVTRIEGCFYNVVGFPLAKFYTVGQSFEKLLSQLQDASNAKEN